MTDIPAKLITTYSAIQLRDDLDIPKRKSILEKQSIISNQTPPFPNNIADVIPIPFHEELIVVLFWFLFFGFLLYGPFIFLFLILVKAYKLLVLIVIVLIGISNIPIKYDKNSCYGYFITLLLKYHSHRGIWSHYIPEDAPVIIVAPPHGVFPFGSLIASLAIPKTSGVAVRGIAASVLLYVPFIGNFLRYIGIIDASRSVVSSHLSSHTIIKQKITKDNGDTDIVENVQYNSIGISSGGIAEIFRTHYSVNSDSSIDKSTNNKPRECIILKNRHGICKIALETGAYIIPSYIFGNNQCFSVWYDKYGILEAISRYLRISICFFWGRWGLPIPYRVPILGVLGKPIKVEKTRNPTREQIQQLLNQLEKEMINTFELYKSAYGWNHMELEIQ